MKLTDQEIQAVRETWGIVLSKKEIVGQLFYSRLFEIAPGVKHLFKEDISEQAAKLVSMVTIIAAKLNKLDDVLTEVSFLAKKHNKYGAKQEHYAAVGAALLWTLEQGLGSRWTPEVQAAWTKVYTILSEAMIHGQKEHAVA